jgi:hypothetical protein
LAVDEDGERIKIHMSDDLLYKVCDTETGLFMTKNGGWTKKGFTWESLGKLKLSMQWRFTTEEVAPSNLKIQTIRLVTEPCMDLQDLVDREQRLKQICSDFGSNTKDLIRKIEDRNLIEEYKVVLVIQTRYDYLSKSNPGFVEFQQAIKGLKIKQTTDFMKSASHNDYPALALKSKAIAMQIKLAMQTAVKALDIKDLTESELDT